jgi:nitrilase
MYSEQYRSLVSEEPEILCRGGSIIVSPLGKVIAGPLLDKAGALIEELDLEEIALSKLDFDAIGHYSRDDIFEFNVSDQPDLKKE